MIRIHKPFPPARLEIGIDLTMKNNIEFDTNETAYLKGIKKFDDFKQDIYGHRTVKDALKGAQHEKCCYCEGRFSAFAVADVEHYRPKGSIRQDGNSARLFPGYYWLAYSWNNLYWCCQVCNRNYKKDLFPLADPTKRVRSHRHDIADENPLLLDPGTMVDLRMHIQFQKEHAIGLSEAGKTTIQVIGLNRPELKEERLERFKKLEGLKNVIRGFSRSKHPDCVDLLENARRELANATRPEARFSAMAVDFLESVETEVQ